MSPNLRRTLVGHYRVFNLQCDVVEGKVTELPENEEEKLSKAPAFCGTKIVLDC